MVFRRERLAGQTALTSMNKDQESSANLSNLEMDLLRSFQPSWVKDSGSGLVVDGQASPSSGRREVFDDGRYDETDEGWRRKPRKRPPGGNRDRDDRRNSGSGKDKGRDRMGEDRVGRPVHSGPRPQPTPILEGWEVHFLAEPRGVEGLAKQIKATAKAHSLFDLARLVLEKSPRYLVAFRGGAGTALYQVVADGTLWPSRQEAVSRVLGMHLDRFYRKEQVEVDPPKGLFPVVAQCGMSRVFLGPPNHHDYDLKVRKLHAERFNRIPFDDYKARIRMLRDEESIQKWMTSQCVKDIYHPLKQAADGETAAPLAGMVEVEQHFNSWHADMEVLDAPGEFTVPGPVAVNDSAPLVLDFVRGELDKLIRFPLPLAHTLGRELATAGLQVFKAHDNVTYVSVARPRPLDRQATPVSEGIGAILDYLEAHPDVPRAAQWQALLNLKPVPEGGDTAARESEVLRDLYWLLQQGHVVDFAKKGLEIASKSPPRRKPSPTAPSTETPVEDTVSQPAAADTSSPSET